jgi:hypothetical protein
MKTVAQNKPGRPQEKVSLKSLNFKQALKGLLEVDPAAVEPERAEKLKAQKEPKK